MNVLCVVGNVGKNAELRFTGSQEAVLGWGLAVTQGRGEKESTFWLDCSLWGKRAESLAEHVKKGTRLAVTGQLGTREHNGKTYLTLRVSDLMFVGSKPKEPTHDTPKPDLPGDDPNDEIPF